MTIEITIPKPGLFICTRASTWDKKPCDEAFESHIPYVNIVTRKTHIQTVWLVQIDDIMKFVETHGQCIISTSPSGFGTIQIYDDYVE